MIDTKKIGFWLDNALNVLLIGEHGVGKTAVVKEAFTAKYGEMGKKWLYFSASTMDPWVDFIGIPREMTDDQGNPYLDLVRPRALRDDQVEAIFIDEFNRAPAKVRNAIMELIQFKSINGHRFPNIKVIWAAINPYDDNGTYDVERLDPAQADRFHIHYTVPYAIDMKYFTEKYGDLVASAAAKWWKELPKDIQKLVSPRRLDYTLEIINLGGSVRNDVIDAKANVTKLIEVVNGVSRLDNFKKFLSNGKRVEAKNFLKDNANFNACEEYVVQNFETIYDILSNEHINMLRNSQQKIRQYIDHNKHKFPDLTLGVNVNDPEAVLYSIPDLSLENYMENRAKTHGVGKYFRRTKAEVNAGLTKQAALDARKSLYRSKSSMTQIRFPVEMQILFPVDNHTSMEHSVYYDDV